MGTAAAVAAGSVYNIPTGAVLSPEMISSIATTMQDMQQDKAKGAIASLKGAMREQ